MKTRKSQSQLIASHSIVAIIPARGGSKGIPHKNIKKLAEKPLIAWTIEAAVKCRDLDRIIVSTDDPSIAQIAEEFGAEIPFIRPAILATDESTTYDVVEHAIEWIINNDHQVPEFVLLLQPTSPLRTVDDINTAIHLIKTRNAPAVVSVCESTQHPYLMKRIRKDGTLENFSSDIPKITRRQEFPDAYLLNGAIYLIRWEILKEKKKFFPENTLAYVMPKERSIDIDTPFDFFVAEQLMSQERHKV